MQNATVRPIRPAKFPIDALPTGLRQLCGNCPQAAITAFTLIAGAAGPSARVFRPTTQEWFTPQMLVVIQAEDGLPEWLPSLLSPLRQYQQQLLAHTCREGDEGAFSVAEEQIKSDRREFFRHDRFPDPAHLQYFERKLRRINLKRRPLIFMEDPGPGTMVRLFRQSPDHGIFPAWIEPKSFMESVARSEECNFMLRSLSGQSFMRSLDDGGVVVDQAYVSGLAVCAEDELKRLITTDCELFRAPGQVFVMDACDGTRKGVLAASLQESYGWWNRLLSRLLSDRFSLAPRSYTISAGAEEALNAAYKREFRKIREKCNISARTVSELSIKLMLLLHLCQDNPPDFISDKTAKAAIRIACWLLAESQRVINELRNDGLETKRRADCALMLQKILEKGPMTLRELARTYDVQRQATLKPILEELIQSGKVSSDSNGLLRVCGDEEEVEKSENGDFAKSRTDNTDTQFSNE